MKLIVFMWAVAIGIITYGHSKNGGSGLPPAYGYTGAATVYSLLGGLAAIPGAAPLAGVFAVSYTAKLYWQIGGATTPAATAATPARKAA